MKIGFIKPNYPNEKRVALLPKDINNFKNELYIEKGFGSIMGIADEEYVEKGCVTMSRAEIFKRCHAIFSLKLIQESDYSSIKKDQIIIGWTHPYGSGRKFMETQGQEKELYVIDLDNIFPKLFYKNEEYIIESIPRNFVYKNSVNAGYAATMHGLLSYGLLVTNETKIAVLASGNVSQGAFIACSKLGAFPRMFYRKTIDEFYASIEEYDVIINGIEVDDPSLKIINKERIKQTKKDVLLIDAAADAGNAIEGTDYTTHEHPIKKVFDRHYYCINNTPSLLYRKSSEDISEAFSKYVYGLDFRKILQLAKGK